MEEEIRFLGDLHRLELRPGDRFVLTMPRVVCQAQAEMINAQWEQYAGPDAPPLLILDGGARLGVVNTTKA